MRTEVFGRLVAAGPRESSSAMSLITMYLHRDDVDCSASVLVTRRNPETTNGLPPYPEALQASKTRQRKDRGQLATAQQQDLKTTSAEGPRPTLVGPRGNMSHTLTQARPFIDGVIVEVRVVQCPQSMIMQIKAGRQYVADRQTEAYTR